MRFGLRRSPPEKTAHRFGAHHLVTLGATPKGAGQLTPCQRIDQGDTETCHACSAAACCWVAMNAAGRPTFIPSQVLIASCTYADVRAAAHPSGTLPELVDAGADLQDDATAMAKWGIGPMGAPVRNRFCDIPDPTGYGFPEPDVGALEVAGQDLIGGEYQIAVDTSAPNTVALCIDAGIPVWLGTFVDTAFQNLGAHDVAQPANENDPNGGGHAMYVSGYRTAADGSFEFRVENSWGSSWADGGAVWASSAWLKACWSLWPFKVAS